MQGRTHATSRGQSPSLGQSIGLEDSGQIQPRCHRPLIFQIWIYHQQHHRPRFASAVPEPSRHRQARFEPPPAKQPPPLVAKGIDTNAHICSTTHRQRRPAHSPPPGLPSLGHPLPLLPPSPVDAAPPPDTASSQLSSPLPGSQQHQTVAVRPHAGEDSRNQQGEISFTWLADWPGGLEPDPAALPSFANLPNPDITPAPPSAQICISRA
ncbi:hypothetical protein Dimus_029064 [Dionaea muscipula]